mgnify:CR=1 FL=1
MLGDKQPVFSLEIRMLTFSDLSESIECACDDCIFKAGCPFSEFLIVDCPMQERPRRV